MNRSSAPGSALALVLLLLVALAGAFLLGDGSPVGPAQVASADLDTDGDTVPDAGDNCVSVPNPAQTNTDSALQAAGASVTGDALGNACDSDADNDGAPDSRELYLSTSPLDNCGTDAWHVDFDDNRIVDIGDVLSLKPPFGASAGRPEYRWRHDVADANGVIDISDVLELKPFFDASCTRAASDVDAASNGAAARNLQVEPARNPACEADIFVHHTAIQSDVAGCGVLNSGEVWNQGVDLVIPGRGMDYVFARTYRSGMTYDGPLGRNWEHNYNRRLIVEPDQDVMRADGYGRVDTYDESAGSYTSPTGFYTRLVKNANGTYTERFADGSVVQYAAADLNGIANMTLMSDSNGNTMQYQYDGLSRLVRVVDTMGRNIDYSYNLEGRLERVTDFSGRYLRFFYDGNYNLAKVVTPVVTGTVTGNNFPDGLFARYGYSAPNANQMLNNLTSVALSSGAVSGDQVATYSYDALDRLVTAAVGGTNSSGVPAGGTYTLNYGSLSPLCPLPAETCVTDPNGNRVEYRFSSLGNPARVEEFTNRDIRATDPASYVSTMTYNADGELLTMTRPEGNSVQYTYDSGNGNRLAQGNLLTVRAIADGDRGGDQSFVQTSYAYEPVYQQVRALTDPRGNDASYVPPNGGSWSAARYTTNYTFDYEEGCDYAAVGAKIGRSAAEVQTMLTAAGMCASALGDINLDTLTTQVNGNVIRIKRPPVVLLPGSGQSAIDGSLQVPIELIQLSLMGQPTLLKDPESNVQTLEYYPENDPNGDSIIDNPSGNPTTGGYLKQVNLDTASDPARNSQTNPTPVNVRNRYSYDAVGHLTSLVDGRGVARSWYWGSGDQIVQAISAAAVGQLPSVDPPEPEPLSDFQYLERYHYDLRGNLVLRQVEDRGNMSGTDGNLLMADLPSYVTNPDPTGGTAFQDTVYKYDALGRRLELLEEVGTIVGPPEHPRTKYRYDRNGNTAIVMSPAANLASGHPDRQVSNVLSYVYDERDLLFTSTGGGTTSQFDALAANDDIPEAITDSADISTYSSSYDTNANLMEEVDPADTNGTGGPESTRYLYDGLDRLVSAVDAAGGQSFYQYDPASNLTSERAYGPVGGATPTSNAAATFTQPLTPSSFTQQQLARSDYKYDERNRLFEVNGHLYACNGSNPACTGVAYVRPPVITDGPLGTMNDGIVVRRPEYDKNSRLTFAVEDDNATDRYYYDGASRRIKATDAENNQMLWNYNDSGDTTSSVQTERSSTGVTPPLTETFTDRYVYDSLNRLTRAVDNLGQTHRYAYDSRDNLVSGSDAQNSTLVPDPLGQYPGNINNPGNTRSYVYDGLSRRVASVSDLRVGGQGGGAIDLSNPSNPDGKVVADSKYDVNGRERAVSDDGSQSGDNNTSIGVIEDIDSMGNVTRTTYDDLNRPKMLTYDDGSMEQYIYDRDDNVTRYTDRNGNIHDYTYDGLNRRIRDNITRATGVIGTTLQQYEYDALSRLTRATDNNDPTTPTDDSTTTYAYDSLGRALEETQQLGTGSPTAVSSRWSGDGNRLALIYPSNKQVDYQYDALDRVIRTQVAGEPLPTATYSYIGERLLERVYGTGPKLSYRHPTNPALTTYDGAGRPTQLRHLRADNSTIADFEYTYDRMSNRLSEVRNHSGRTDAYAYDSLYRVVQYQRDMGSLTPPPPVSYQLDGDGNWASHGTPNNLDEYSTFQGAPRTYDLNGALKADGTAPGSRSYNYDALQRLVRVDRIGSPTQTVAQYTYDAMDRRITRSVTNSPPYNDTVSYTYDAGQGEHLIEGFSAVSGRTEWVQATDRDFTDSWANFWSWLGFVSYDVEDYSGHGTHGTSAVLRMDRQSAPGQPLFFHENAGGDSAALSDIGQQVVERYTYDAYGVPRFEDPLNNPTPFQSSQQANPLLFNRMYWEPETRLYSDCDGGSAYKADEGRTVQRVVGHSGDGCEARRECRDAARKAHRLTAGDSGERRAIRTERREAVDRCRSADRKGRTPERSHAVWLSAVHETHQTGREADREIFGAARKPTRQAARSGGSNAYTYAGNNPASLDMRGQVWGENIGGGAGGGALSEFALLEVQRWEVNHESRHGAGHHGGGGGGPYEDVMHELGHLLIDSAAGTGNLYEEVWVQPQPEPPLPNFFEPSSEPWSPVDAMFNPKEYLIGLGQGVFFDLGPMFGGAGSNSRPPRKPASFFEVIVEIELPDPDPMCGAHAQWLMWQRCRR